MFETHHWLLKIRNYVILEAIALLKTLRGKYHRARELEFNLANFAKVVLAKELFSL